MKVRIKNPIWGVPITFLYSYNPEQFEIVALGNSRENFTPTKDYINPKKHMMFKMRSEVYLCTKKSYV